MKDWIKKTSSKKSSGSAVQYCSELPSKGFVDAKNNANLKFNSNYLNNVIKSFRGHRKGKVDEEEANHLKAQVEIDEKIAPSESKNDLEQILTTIEMKVANNGKKRSSTGDEDALFGSESYYPFMERCTSVEILHNLIEKPNDDLKLHFETEEPNSEVKFADEYSIVFQPEEAAPDDGLEGSRVYSSKKLLLRRLINKELRQEIEPKNDADDDGASVDSWSEIEESFTKIYEPLPLSPPASYSNAGVRFQSLSKEEISRCVSSNPQSISRPTSAWNKKLMIEVEVHNNDGNCESASDDVKNYLSLGLSKNRPNWKIPSRPDSAVASEKLSEEQLSDSLSWKSISIGGSEDAEESCYVSRSEILGRNHPIYVCEKDFPYGIASEIIHLPFPPISRSAIIRNASRNERLKKFDTDLEDDRLTRERSLSLDSCDSWSLDDYELPLEKPISDVGLNDICSNERDNWFTKSASEREEQLSEIDESTEVGNLKKHPSEDSWNFSDCSSKLSRAQILASSGSKKLRVKPLPALELQERVRKFLASNSHIKTPTKEKLMLILKDHVKQSSNLENSTDAVSRNKEVRERLKEALVSDSDNMSNVSLGFIYVPMEENTKLFKASKETADYDTFGSIDSLIFEPKSLNHDFFANCAYGEDQLSFENHRSSSLLKSSLSPVRESPYVPQDGPRLNGPSPPPPPLPSINFDARQKRQKESSSTNGVTHCLQSSSSSEIVSHPSFAVPDSSRIFHHISSDSKLSDCFKSDCNLTANDELNPFSVNPSHFENENLRHFDDQSTSPLPTAYHPDDIKGASCSDITFVSSSPDESGSVSDTDSATSIESVILNMNVKLPENNYIKKSTSKKKYIVNRGHESDSNSDGEGNSTQVTQLLDFDTSWDYIATPEKESMKTEGLFRSNFKNSDNLTHFKYDHEQFADYLANSHFHTTLAKEIHLEDEAKAQYESSDDTPKVTDEINLYEACDSLNEGSLPCVVLLKHHVYQSIESLQSLSYSDAEGSPHSGSIRSNRFFKSMNGAYVDNSHDDSQFDEAPFVISNGSAVPLTESIFNGTQERKKNYRESTTQDYLPDLCPSDVSKFMNEALHPSLEDTHSPAVIEDKNSAKNTNVKIKKVQKVGVSIMGSGKNDLMIQELKLKLRRKFVPDEENECSLESENSLTNTVEYAPLIGCSTSIASKREQLGPQIDRIFKSINFCRSESGSTLTAKESSTGVENGFPIAEIESYENFDIGDKDPIFFSSSDSSLVWVPTPDYTPHSTLPKNPYKEESYLLPFQVLTNGSQEDLKSFVRNHLIAASPSNKYADSALSSKESRARRARSGSPKRSVRFDTTRKLPDLTLGATWSDLESVIFAEDKSLESSIYDGTGRPDSRLTNSQMNSKMPGTRMESYKDEWLLWDQLAKMRRSKTPEDRERWQSEKTKRMLLWVHLSNNDSHIEWCYKSHWWKAKQRASVAWIVQKCHKNKVPSDIEEPYYKDYEGLEHLKPGIVHRLSNADLYCSALANIYGDPNFHNLSHWNIIQALARKGVYVAEPTDVALTETVLIQTTPIKMSAHLAVIEAMMALYIREVVVAERVVQAIQRISGISQAQDIPISQDQEEALVLWVDHSTQALQARIHQQVQQTQDQELPVFPKIQDLSDLSDGIGLAALLAFYCPQELSWGDIAVADPPSMADSLYNIGLVIKFCKESLPYNPCLLTKEDIVYMHSSVKQNILAFVAELFFLMELEPVSCVSFSNTRKTSSKYIQLSSPSMRPAGVPSVRRSHSMNLNDVTDSRSRAESRSENAPSSHNSDYGGRDSSMSDGQESEFLVQKAKGYATLNDMMRNQSPHPSQHDHPHDFFGSRNISKEKYNTESKEEELGERGKLSRRGSFYGSNNDLNELPPAGIPTRLENRPIGRSRSRRNSINADESQLTIENFGGSQDNLNYISRNPDKEPYIHTGKRESCIEPIPRRSSSQNRDMDKSNDHHRPSMDELDNRVIDKLERDALEREKRDNYHSSKEASKRKDHRRRSQPERVDSSSESEASYEAEKPIGKATSFAELSKLKDQLPGGINIIYMQQSEKEDLNRNSQSKGPEKKTTTFAALPNQTTWRQQSVQNQIDSDGADDNLEPQVVTSELHNVRLKLEEKRRRIEAEKRKMELMMNKQRQKLGKEAFMQAVVKGDLGTEVSNVSKKWLDHEGPKEELRTPDMDAMDYEEYQKSLSQMTDSLTEIQSDIHRLSQQQHQIQTLMHNGMATQQNQFYLHDQQGSPARRMWSQPSSSDGYSSMSPATRRAQWGPPARHNKKSSYFDEVFNSYLCEQSEIYPWMECENEDKKNFSDRIDSHNRLGHDACTDLTDCDFLHDSPVNESFDYKVTKTHKGLFRQLSVLVHGGIKKTK